MSYMVCSECCGPGSGPRSALTPFSGLSGSLYPGLKVTPSMMHRNSYGLSILCSSVKSHHIWAESSEFVSSSIRSWQILTEYTQPFRGARDLAFCLLVPLDSLLVWASSGGSGETERMRRLAWTFAARMGDKYQIRSTWPIFNLWSFRWMGTLYPS